jgi:hypothetical protein
MTNIKEKRLFRLMTMLSFLPLLPVGISVHAFSMEVATKATVETKTQVATPDIRQQDSMRTFMKENPLCANFSDGCSICQIDGNETVCSTPQTACIKREYTCSARK